MPVSVTPRLDVEILKLRRTIGDIYDVNGNLITADTSHTGGGNIYCGSASLFSTWSAAELLDIYNSACIRFIEYVIGKNKSAVQRFLPGYINRAENVNIGTGVIPLSSFTPPLWYVLDIRLDDATELSHYGIEADVETFFSQIGDVINSHKSQFYYIISGDKLQLFNYGGFSRFSVIYITPHIDFVHNSTNPGDVTKYFTISALERIRLIAESLALRTRGSYTLPEQEILTIDMGLQGLQGNRRSNNG